MIARYSFHVDGAIQPASGLDGAHPYAAVCGLGIGLEIARGARVELAYRDQSMPVGDIDGPPH